MSARSDDGSAFVDVVVWLVLVAMLTPVMVAIARSPAQAARVSYSVRAAAEDAAKARDAPSAQEAAAAELGANLLDPGNPRVCAEHSAAVDASHLSARLVDGAPPTPGYVEVVVQCTLDGRLLTGLPFPLRTTVEVRRTHVADVYRRTE